MEEKKVDKVVSAGAHRGTEGEYVLARGERLAMRLWRDEQPGDPKPKSTRDYDVVGFVIAGSAELHLDGEMIELAAGDSWTVPAGVVHTYRIREAFTAVEALTPSGTPNGA